MQRIEIPALKRAAKSGAAGCISQATMAEHLRIGLGQVAVRMGDKAANRAALLRAVEAAAGERCDVVVLPECGFAGWLSSRARDAAEPIPGPFVEELRRAARAGGLAIAAGFEELDGERVYNSAVFIDEQGQLRAAHRKINELELALPLYARGSSLAVTPWRGHNVSLLICADCWRPELVDALHLMGADLLLSPCAWAVEPGGESTNLAWIIETYSQRIGGRGFLIAAANGVGEVTDGAWKGRRLQGSSMLVARGRHAVAPTGEAGLFITDTGDGAEGEPGRERQSRFVPF